jgi:hypothetical protein
MSGLVPRLSQQELNKKRNIIYQDQTAYPDESLGTNFIHPLNAAKLIAYKRVARQQREALIRRTTAGHKVFKKRKSFKKERKSKKRKAKKNHKIDSKKNKHKSQ